MTARRLRNALVALLGILVVAAALAFGNRIPSSVAILALDDENAVLDVVLGGLPPEQYFAAARSALAAGEPDTANSILELARSHGIEVPEAMANEVRAAQGLNGEAVRRDLWQCVSAGTVESEVGLACVVATDMTAVGDVRDLAVEGARMARGDPYDEVVLAMSVVGLGVTAATVATTGAAVPLRVGLSFLKAAKKAGKLPPALSHEIKSALADGIDGAAVRRATELATSLRLTELRQVIPTIIRPAAFRRVSRIAEDIGTVYGAGGVRGLNRSLHLAQNGAGMATLAARAKHFGKGFAGALALVGAGLLSVSGVVATAASWTIAALAWLALAIPLVFRFGRAAFRMLRWLLFGRAPA